MTTRWLALLALAGCSWEPSWTDKVVPRDDSGDPGAVASGDCDLADDLASPMFWEGDTVLLQLRCTGDLDSADAEIRAESLPDNAIFDDDSLRMSWTTGPADGGKVELVFSSRPRGATSQVPAVHTVTVWVADNPDLPDAVPPQPDAYTEEWGLPVLHLDPVGMVTQEYTDATVNWQGQELPARIKVRGATSSQFPKQSYTLDFDHEEPILPGFGGVSRDHLVLLANFDDNSHVRQKLTYDLWAAIADFEAAKAERHEDGQREDDEDEDHDEDDDDGDETGSGDGGSSDGGSSETGSSGKAADAHRPRLTPRTFFVVVYQERNYQGLYVALDRVDNEFVRQMGLDDQGNLYKSIDHDANFFDVGSDGLPKDTLHDGYEKKEGLPEDDFSDLDALVDFTSTSSLPQLLDDAQRWLDPVEFRDWLLLVHYALAQDSAGKNAWLYREPDQPWFRYAPWDMNHSWGQDHKTRRLSAEKIDDYVDTNKIFAALQVEGAAAEALWARYAELRAGGPFDPDNLRAMVDGYYEEITLSALRDEARWADEYRTYQLWAEERDEDDDWTDFAGEQAYLYQWLDDRAAQYEAHAR